LREIKTKAIFILVLFCSLVLAWPQNASLSLIAPRLANGINLYGQGRWGEAVVELRRSQSETTDTSLRGEAQFWIAMAELSAGEYATALHDFDEFLRIDPRSKRAPEIPYHKGRCYYYLERYNEALVLFRQYSDSIRLDGRYMNGVRVDDWANDTGTQDDYNLKASAIFWMGESLYALEQYDKAEEMFNIIIKQYTKSHKFESSVNRNALIKEKRIQSDLLAIVRSNKGSSAQRNDAISNYQEQLGTILGTGRM
jgi:tetratricopeptide (TPR) repeat protein